MIYKLQEIMYCKYSTFGKYSQLDHVQEIWVC